MKGQGQSTPSPPNIARYTPKVSQATQHPWDVVPSTAESKTFSQTVALNHKFDSFSWSTISILELFWRLLWPLPGYFDKHWMHRPDQEGPSWGWDSCWRTQFTALQSHARPEINNWNYFPFPQTNISLYSYFFRGGLRSSGRGLRGYSQWYKSPHLDHASQRITTACLWDSLCLLGKLITVKGTVPRAEELPVQ